MTEISPDLHVAYQPRLPSTYRPGIGIIGCGGIVRNAHLPAYKKYGLQVVGVYDISAEAMHMAQKQFGIEYVFQSLEELLACQEIEVVDIGTHPAQRAALIERALDAGKHVLSQKPFALDLVTARRLTEQAQGRGLKLAVNQNGRWAPPWRVATLLVQQGVIGEVLAVTHLFETNFSWVTRPDFDTMPHWLLYDYAIHWIDISRCWLEGAQATVVRAREYRPPNEPDERQASWGGWMEVSYLNGADAHIRSIGGAHTKREGHPFWIHGSRGTIRGSALGQDFVELERDGLVSRYQLEGNWFPDGFAGTMGELLCAIAEEREPYNSAHHNLLTLEFTLAACRSAELDGQPVALEEAAQ